MTKRKNWTPLRRMRLFDAHGGICHICGREIDGVREGFEVEHLIPLAMGGDDDESNCAPAHVACHREKTATDKGQIAKANRVRAKHNGAWRPKSTLAGSKASGWKRKINGEAVRRED